MFVHDRQILAKNSLIREPKGADEKIKSILEEKLVLATYPD